MLRFVLLCGLVSLSIGAVPRGRTMRPMLDGRIVGGEATTIEDIPYQLSLQSYGRHICGASIVSKTRAITAAHCTSGSSASSLTLRAGSTYEGEGGVVHQVEAVKMHPNYDSWTIDFDVSVLVVKGFEFGPGVAPIGIHPQGAELEEGVLATVSGWGALSSGGPSPKQLQRVDVPKVSDSSCGRSYGDITPRMTCHGFDEGGKDSCQGDSGGPLVHNGQLVGIVSWGAGCAAAGYPGVYGKVSDKDMHEHIVANL